MITSRSSTLAPGCKRTLSLSRLDLAIVGFGASAVLLAWGLATVHQRPFALIALIPAFATLAWRRRPLLAGIAIGASATILRLAYVGIGYSSQIDVTRAAAGRALDGLSPYGVLLSSSTAPPEPYVYGPLGILWWQPGPTVEFAAAVAVTALLIATRSWLTLALYSGLPFAVYLTSTGVNDYSPGLLIAVGLILLRNRPVAGGLVLAIAGAIKPYAFAWFLPAIGTGGLAAAVALIGATAVLWSPVLAWGAESVVRSLALHAELIRPPTNTLNIPVLRWLAFPLSAAAMLMRNWGAAVISGALAFVVYFFLDSWASLGYWVAVIPVAGIAIEDRWARR